MSDGSDRQPLLIPSAWQGVPVQSVMATIQHLPNELLERIFLCGAEPPLRTLDDHIVVHHHRPDFATTVSHVSARWRAVALRKDLLWTRIVASDAQPHSPDRVRAYRRRAENCSLDLQLILCGPSNETTYRYLERADRLISDMVFSALPVASWGNIRSLFFRATHHGQAWTLLSQHLRSTAMPLLTSLVVDIQPLPDAPHAEIHVEVFDLTNTLGGVEIAPTFGGTTPNLQTMVLRNMPRYWLPLVLTPDTGVQDVMLYLWRNDPRVPPARFLSYLARSAMLQRLSICTSGVAVLTDWNPQTTVGNVVSMPELRDLTLKGNAPARLLPYVAAPSLARLEVVDAPLLAPGNNLLSLTALVLVRHPITRTGHLAQALGEHAFPALQTLVLYEADERLLTELHLVPLPSLKTIALIRPKMTVSAWLLLPLRDMLEARARIGRKLDTLALDDYRWEELLADEPVLCEVLQASVGTVQCINRPPCDWISNAEYL